MSKLHKIQAFSLVVAGGILWLHPFLEHKTAMIVASIIIWLNAVIEVFG